jgi:hypothetical protein
MLMRLYHTRFSEQIETADAETICRGGSEDHEPARLISPSGDGTNAGAPCSA